MGSHRKLSRCLSCLLHSVTFILEACNGSEWLNKLKEINVFKSAGLVLARFNGVVRAKCANVISNLKCCLQVKLPKHERLLFSMSCIVTTKDRGVGKPLERTKESSTKKEKEKKQSLTFLWSCYCKLLLLLLLSSHC